MLREIHIGLRLIVLIVFCCGCCVIVPAQSTYSDLKNKLRVDAGFQDSDFEALEKGETVVRSLKGSEKREVSICGVIKLTNIPAISLPELVEKLSQRNNETVMKWGVFGNPPVVDDLRTLELEDRDLDDMKKCEIGDCDLKMSAAMINRLRNEINWEVPNYRTQAMQLYRQMMTEYVGDYVKDGNKALLQYDNRKTPVRLVDDHRMLLNGALFLNDLSPEFGKYLRQFPAHELAGVANTIEWTKVDFGLKPILTITHTTSFAFQENNVSQFIIATRGIYASRYVDSSLAVILLVRDSTGDTGNTFLVFTNLSRSNSLTGLLGGLKRSIVSSESEGKVRDMLIESKAKLQQATKDPATIPQRSDNSYLNAVGIKSIMMVVLVLTVGIVALFLFRRRSR